MTHIKDIISMYILHCFDLCFYVGYSLSDENSVTLIEEGAFRLPPDSEEEDEEKVEKIGLHLSETADRLNDDYKSKPSIKIEKPNTLLVTLMCTLTTLVSVYVFEGVPENLRSEAGFYRWHLCENVFRL